jgi:T5SS/PEP-CTERM-associated repeat protein
MRLLPSVALPRSALFAAVAVTVLAMPGTVGAQISSTGTVSDPVGPGNTNIANTLKIGNSINTGSILVENNSLLEAGTNVSQGQHSLSVRNGALNIQTGGDVTAISSISVNGTGTITVDGSGSTLSSQNAAIFVGGSSTGVLNVQNSASVTSGQFSIGSNSSPATGDGTVNLSGSGSTIDAVIVNVGESGFGRLNISDNAVLTSTRSNTFGENSGNNAILNIQSGGKFIHTGTGSTRIGQQGASATITVDGAGSQLIINDLINMGIIGGGNGGTIDVTNGGTASFQSTLISQGTINVNGTNSSLSTGQESLAMGISPAMGTSPGGNVTLNIGDNPGTIGVESAGTVNSVTGTVSGDITSTVTANVSGANAHWNLLGLRSSGSGAQLTVGSRGIGTLNINNQGTVTIDAQGTPTGSLGGISVGGQTGGETSTGTVNLDGTGASLVVVS